MHQSLISRRFFDDGPFSQMQRAFAETIDRFMRERPSLLTEVEAFLEPRLDLTENEKDLKVTVELPGVDPKNVEVSFREGNLVIKGEKKAEREEKQETTYRSERVFGAFERVIALPAAVDQAKIAASYKNGVLTILAPKTAEARAAERKIPIAS
jgi:HSP20 family protein